MAELLIKAQTNGLPGSWEVGMIVEVKPDGYQWGSLETLPKFWIVKVPLIPPEHAFFRRLMEFQTIEEGETRKVIGKRACLLKNIPQAVLDKLNSTGILIIKASAQYNGEYDYTIAQIKNYFFDKDTNTSVNIEL